MRMVGRTRRYYLLPVAALMLRMLSAGPAAAEIMVGAAPPPEPPLDVLRSGQCHVAACTLLDFGAHTFLIFLPGSTHHIRRVSRHACTCGTTTVRPVRNGAVFAFETPYGNHLVSLRSAPLESTTPDGTALDSAALDGAAQAAADGYRELSDVTWQDSDFSDFRVFEKRLPDSGGKAQAVYRFIPKGGAFRFRGTTQPIVFASYRPQDPADPGFQGYGPDVRAEVRLMSGLWLVAVMSPYRVLPRDWIAVLESSAEAADLRLAPKAP